MLSRQDVETIARKEASKAIPDLSLFDVKVESADGAWQVAFSPKDVNSQGGGPVYVIDAAGKIVSAKYYQ